MGFESGVQGSSSGLTFWGVQATGHSCPLCPRRESPHGRGREEVALCVPGAERQLELLAGSSGRRGQGPAGGCPPKAHQPSAAAGRSQGPRREDLGEAGGSRVCHLSVPVATPWYWGSAEESLACQDCAGADTEAERGYDLPEVTQGLPLSPGVASPQQAGPGGTWRGP